MINCDSKLVNSPNTDGIFISANPFCPNSQTPNPASCYNISWKNRSRRVSSCCHHWRVDLAVNPLLGNLRNKNWIQNQRLKVLHESTRRLENHFKKHLFLFSNQDHTRLNYCQGNVSPCLILTGPKCDPQKQMSCVIRSDRCQVIRNVPSCLQTRRAVVPANLKGANRTVRELKTRRFKCYPELLGYEDIAVELWKVATSIQRSQRSQRNGFNKQER
jgi:hypothetical protein